MSIPVDLADVARQLAQFDRAYLLSTADDRVKVVSVRVAEGAGTGTLLVRAPGRGSLANVAANPVVTLLFPPVDDGAHADDADDADTTPAAHPGFSLLVDGRAEADGDDVRVTPTGAVLHKPAP
jgi:hypothetical protein